MYSQVRAMHFSVGPAALYIGAWYAEFQHIEHFNVKSRYLVCPNT
jgi:hypothetical protein